MSRRIFIYARFSTTSLDRTTSLILLLSISHAPPLALGASHFRFEAAAQRIQLVTLQTIEKQNVSHTTEHTRTRRMCTQNHAEGGWISPATGSASEAAFEKVWSAEKCLNGSNTVIMSYLLDLSP